MSVNNCRFVDANQDQDIRGVKRFLDGIDVFIGYFNNLFVKSKVTCVDLECSQVKSSDMVVKTVRNDDGNIITFNDSVTVYGNVAATEQMVTSDLYSGNVIVSDTIKHPNGGANAVKFVTLSGNSLTTNFLNVVFPFNCQTIYTSGMLVFNYGSVPNFPQQALGWNNQTQFGTGAVVSGSSFFMSGVNMISINLGCYWVNWLIYVNSTSGTHYGNVKCSLKKSDSIPSNSVGAQYSGNCGHVVHTGYSNYVRFSDYYKVTSISGFNYHFPTVDLDFDGVVEVDPSKCFVYLSKLA